ncbi:zinc-binding dehydrogenase [Plantactinospora endophytica]|uniref:Oxidoreductase n=1 Tax=Plantactinospora endophytica TaxID=673535 RepID=A0ABQ4E1N6_9ACTN|nr:zinc-binding dehydrogenase [Plantactinospora endophytica]GIG88586.1 oxidoreductase [Plantactinospora endophytica]
MPRVVSFTGPRAAEVVDEPARPLTEQDVRLRTLFSGISAGTELTAYRGTNPYLSKRWDNDRRLFVDGTASREYPLLGWGYEEVGEVVEIGGGVDTVSVGDRIWGTWGHRSGTVVTAEYARDRVLAPEVDPRVGMFSQIGGIALNVVLDADIHVGETVAVFGLGVPGQLVAQLARLNGGRVIAVDGVASRRELALKLGAAEALDPADGEIAEQIRARTDGRGADVCLEVTGNYAALHEAIRSVAYSSRVCAAGFMQGDGVGLRLGEEFHHNRVQVVSTQISGVAPALQHRWNRFRLDSTAISLAASGALRVTDLISHTFPLERAAEAFELLDGASQDVLQVVLQANP